MVDCIVKKGAYHRSYPEDYALAEEVSIGGRDVPLIIVCDGCSGGYHTEVGAMIQATAAKMEFLRQLRDSPNGDAPDSRKLFQAILERIYSVTDELGLPWEQMIATLRMAWIIDEVIYTIEAGDGYQIGKKADVPGIGTPLAPYYTKYEYEQNAPYYPAYIAFGREKEYKESFEHNPLQVTSSDLDRTLTTASNTVFHNEYPAKDFKFFGMATDGLASYRLADNTQISDLEVVKNLTAFKGEAIGEFLVRRFQKYDKELISQGADNYDDVSIALISVEECLRRNSY
jgi:hypothetical protein